MSFLKRLFGGGDTPPPPAAPSVDHKGYAITPDPEKAGGQWRIAATIEKDGRTHRLIRADTMADRDQCADAALAKAKQVIDEQGDRLFG